MSSSTNGGETISFDVFAPNVVRFFVGSVYADLIDSGGVSDRWVATDNNLSPDTYHVVFASDGENGSFPGLPPIPPGAVTTGPFIEDGTVQAVGVVDFGGKDNDFFFIQSDKDPVSGVPEPGSMALTGTGLALAAFLGRKLRAN